MNYLDHPPFDVLNSDERTKLEKHSQIVYLDEGQSVPSQWQGDFFVIIKGALKQFLADELIAGLSVSDWFNTTTKNGETYNFITSEQSLLYRINGNALNDIADQNPTLKKLLYADLASRRELQNVRHAHYESQQLLHQSIESLGHHIKPAHFVASTATLLEATIAMNEVHAKHVLVKGDKVGMFTQADVCHAVGDGADFDTSVLPYTNFNLSTIHVKQDLSEALLIMLERKIHRLPIVDDHGDIVGVLGQTELLNFLTNHSQLIVAKIEQASSLESLGMAVDMIGKYIRNSVQTGVKTHVISRTVQSLNAQVFAKAWSLIAPQSVVDNTCLFVMGSEGRGEQIMRTDQDNALIIKDGFYDANLAEYAQRFNDALAQFGYPYCDGHIMLNNELWRKPLSAFKDQVLSWYQHADESMIWLATLLDAHFVAGDKDLFDELMAYTMDAKNHAAANFINRFAKAILQFGDGSHFWQKFTGSANHDVDLKKAGIFPIVHGVRALALEYGITVTSTRARLDELEKQSVLDQKTTLNLKEALDFFLTKRLLVALATTDKSARKVNPNQLSALERDLLKESLAVAKDFKGFVTRHYRLDVFGV
ncbi:DUF294 nucleotidyltransferase-like domain-containing protein [Moraxella nasovis]|uniref:DUF294 nucleotidyltransferase-like domain-containing protein n=1 Tax=Moraxella nasovis TaxID=2904121 RepID=UPI001F60BD83|nr:DUF294 nucleotidyltransferase-like domain-containing protein [Moraxella nasovis]UNU73692.1 DUF294 nucleotidyltransferase-like domain-containing protein [Moraxella nasovis]